MEINQWPVGIRGADSSPVLTSQPSSRGERAWAQATRRFGHWGLQLVAATAAILLGAPGVAFAADSPSGKDTTYYISLGDSLASGYQPNTGKDTHVAYPDQLFEQLKQREPGLQHIRLGCSGETTGSLIKGGTCAYPNAKSQLDAARQVLARYHGKVRYVTIDIGADDLKGCVAANGAIDQACLKSTSKTIVANLAEITGALRKAGTAGVHYVGVTYYNPFLATWLLGDAGQESAKASATLVGTANAAISQVYSAAGFKVADVAGAFSSDDFSHFVQAPGLGKVPVNVAKLCELTWECTAHDPHADAAGHKVIAGAIAAVLSQEYPTQQPVASGGSESKKAGAVLAETGSSSSTPILACFALGLVVTGAGVLFFGHKRRAGEQG